MRERAVTGLLLILAALALVFLASPNVAFFAALALGLAGGVELARLVSPRSDPGATLGVACLAAILAATAPPSLALAGALLGAALLVASPQRGLPATLAGIVWIGGGLAGLRALASIHPSGASVDPRPLVLLLLLPIWAGDTFAYFGGRAFGKRPLLPKVSPKKTVEGALCGLAGALAVAALAALWLRVPLPRAFVVGLAAGLLGPAGDLLESLLKRRAGVKDSGTLLPGHGGILDRVDSLLLAAPIAAVLLRA